MALINGTYVSVWDGGHRIATPCVVDSISGVVTAQRVDDELDDLQTLDSEHVEIGCTSGFNISVHSGDGVYRVNLDELKSGLISIGYHQFDVVQHYNVTVPVFAESHSHARMVACNLGGEELKVEARLGPMRLQVEDDELGPNVFEVDEEEAVSSDRPS